MPISMQCPACSHKLRVPDNLCGKTIRCPSCKHAFRVDEGGEAPPAETAVTAEPTTRGRPAASDGYEKGSRRRDDEAEDDRDVPVDDEDVPREDDEDYEDRRDRRRRRRTRRRSEAGGVVAGPAIALMIVGGLSVVVHAVDLVLRLLGIAMGAHGVPKGDPAAAAGFAVGTVLGAILAFTWGVLVISGAVQMYRLRTYGFAMTAAIVAMVPCSICCVLGLPFGIWALVALNKQEVKDAFR